MDIQKIDKNFDTSFVVPEDLEWFSVREAPFVTFGVTYSEEEGLYRRMPREDADAVSVRVSSLSCCTAGGRVRFVTDSPYLAVRVEEPFGAPAPHMTVAGRCGVAVFYNGRFLTTVMPSYAQLSSADPSHGGDGRVVFDGIKSPYLGEGECYEAELFLPLYSAVNAIYVGVQRGSALKAPKPYRTEKPVLFYGSSITQGGCAAKPGDDYVNRLSRMLDTDVVNLGFSGAALAEESMIDYLAAQDPSVFVMDYDHNAPTPEHLQKTHYALYKRVREAHPTLPIVVMMMPTIEGYQTRPKNAPRREIIFETVRRAREEGDENLYLIDCYGCFGAEVNGECGTVDSVHPDSLGFLRMAERVYPVLKNLLYGESYGTSVYREMDLG